MFPIIYMCGYATLSHLFNQNSIYWLSKIVHRNTFEKYNFQAMFSTGLSNGGPHKPHTRFVIFPKRCSYQTVKWLFETHRVGWEACSTSNLGKVRIKVTPVNNLTSFHILRPSNQPRCGKLSRVSRLASIWRVISAKEVSHAESLAKPNLIRAGVQKWNSCFVTFIPSNSDAL